MLFYFIHTILGILAAIGLASLIQGINQRLNTYCSSGRYLLVLLNSSDADLRLKSTMELLRFSPLGTYCGIIAVDFGIDEEALTACKILQKESNAVEIYTAEEFSKRLRGETVDHDNRTKRNC